MKGLSSLEQELLLMGYPESKIKKMAADIERIDMETFIVTGNHTMEFILDAMRAVK